MRRTVRTQPAPTMLSAYSVDAVRRAEVVARARLAPGALMQRAAAGLAAAVARILTASRGGTYGARAVLLVGPGDNGGDALFAGARLAGQGVRVDAVLMSERSHPAGTAALMAAGGQLQRGDCRPVLAVADLVLDAIVGIGGRPGLSPAAAAAVAAVPPQVQLVAVDLPSGIDPDTGQSPRPHQCGADAALPQAVRAYRTITFGVLKPALLLPPAAHLAGELEVIDLGLDPADLGPPTVATLTAAGVAESWPWPGTDDDKYRRGVLGVVAGGTTYTGAAVLAVGAAVRSGAGMVRYLGPKPATDLVRARWPQSVPGEGRVQAWVLGPGVALDEPGQRQYVQQALDGDLPCVVDAGALELVRSRQAPTLLTPHAGELARLLTRLDNGMDGRDLERADVEREPLRHAQRAATLTGATVLLKGAVTLVVPPPPTAPSDTAPPVLSQGGGPPWLATAGSGDVLSGLAGMLLAAGVSPALAGAMAASVHASAGRVASAGGPLDADRLLEALPAAIAALSDWGYG